MRVYICTNFDAASPAVTLADNPQHARELLDAKLTEVYGAAEYIGHPDIWELDPVGEDGTLGVAEILMGD